METTFSFRYSLNLARMFALMISRTSMKMGHVGSKIRSLGQILESQSRRLRLATPGPLWPSCFVMDFVHKAIKSILYNNKLNPGVGSTLAQRKLNSSEKFYRLTYVDTFMQMHQAVFSRSMTDLYCRFCSGMMKRVIILVLITSL